MTECLGLTSNVPKKSIIFRMLGSGEINIKYSILMKFFSFRDFWWILVSINYDLFSSSRITLHVADHASLSSLDDQIREGNNSTFNGMKNYFLINVPSHMAKDTKSIKKMFEDSSLSFNSLTFAFLLTNQSHGNILSERIK